MKNILILGGSDMLGYGAAMAFLESDMKNYNLSIAVRHSRMNLVKNHPEVFSKVKVIPFSPHNRNLSALCDIDSKTNPDYIINCFEDREVIEKSSSAFIDINVAFPHLLADWSNRCGVRLIHFSTDHVFMGTRGDYTEDDEHDSNEKYGKARSLGEPDHCMVLRAGYVGPELADKKNFLEWAILQKDLEVEGYTNHIFNGLTTKEYGKICKQIIDKNLYYPSKYHLFSPHKMSKMDMLKIVSEKYNLNLKLRPLATKTPSNKSLASTSVFCKKLNVSPFKQQILEL